MRRLALLVLMLALATPAGAQQERIGAIEADAGLRGAVEPQVPRFDIPAPIVLAAPPAFSPVPTAAPDAGRCRMACAQDYYFCLAQDDAAECGPAWRGCVLSCGISATPAAPAV